MAREISLVLVSTGREPAVEKYVLRIRSGHVVDQMSLTPTVTGLTISMSASTSEGLTCVFRRRRKLNYKITTGYYFRNICPLTRPPIAYGCTRWYPSFPSIWRTSKIEAQQSPGALGPGLCIAREYLEPKPCHISLKPRPWPSRIVSPSF